MLISFRVKNFKSIVDTTLDLSYKPRKSSKKRTSGIDFLGTSKRRAVPVLAMYGQNAGGKSAIIQALDVFKKCVTEGVAGMYIPNRLHPELKETIYEVKFLINDDLFSYLLEFTSGGITNERLQVNGTTLYRVGCGRDINLKRLATDAYPDSKLKDVIKVECMKDGSMQRPFLIVLRNNYSGLHPQVSSAANYLSSCLSIHPVVNEYEGGSIRIWKNQNVEVNNSNEEDALFHEVAEYIKKLDIDIDDMRKREVPLEMFIKRRFGINAKASPNMAENYMTHEVITKHTDINGNDVEFTLQQESRGTGILYGLLGEVLPALKQGHVLAIDEMDCSLHPLIMCKVISFFVSKHHNKSNAQLIFTAHNTEPLSNSFLKLGEVGIVRKNKAKGTRIFRLCDIEDVKDDDDFREEYLLGSYSGIPYPYI